VPKKEDTYDKTKDKKKFKDGEVRGGSTTNMPLRDLFAEPSPGEGFDPFKAEDKLVEETTTKKPVVEQGE